MPAHVIGAFMPADLPALRAIAYGAFDAGELTGFARRDLDGLFERLPLRPEATLVALDTDGADGAVAGFFNPSYPLLIVHPAQRRRGHGRRLVEAEAARASERGEAHVELAPPRGNAGALAFCQALGFVYHSSLWQLRLDAAVAVPPPAFPPDVVLRAIRPGADDERFVALHNAAFADHPSPMAVALVVVRHIHGAPEFDPALLTLVAPAGQPDEPLGFARVAIVPNDGGHVEGEVVAIGVLPDWRGRGLGRELLRWSVAALRERGVASITLTVEARNERALGLYERTGFRRTQEWPRWARAV